MRLLGMAERSLDLMLIRASEPSKVAFGKLLQEHGTVIAGIAQSRIEIDSARLIVLSAALQVRICLATVQVIILTPKLFPFRLTLFARKVP